MIVICRQLDVSFNLLRKIEGLECLAKIKKLFLLHNKIASIANLDQLTSLQMLELGSNRIRVRHPRPHLLFMRYILFFAYGLTFPVCKCLCYVHFRLLRIWILLLPWTVCSLARIKSIGCRTLMDCTVWRFSASRCVCARTFFQARFAFAVC